MTGKFIHMLSMRDVDAIKNAQRVTDGTFFTLVLIFFLGGIPSEKCG